MRVFVLIVMLLVTNIVIGEEKVDWPSLESFKFVSGRHAVEEDVSSGSAVFLLKTEEGEYIGEPIDLEIPQYAFYKNESGNIDKVIIIQAEEADGQKAIGAVNVADASLLVGLIHEFEFLGKTMPVERNDS